MIGIIAAFQAEIDELLALMEDAKQEEHYGITFWKGSLAKKDIVLMKSGVGKGNAAMASTILLQYYQPQAIINIGTAGGLKDSQNVLDLVISKTIVQHDYDTSAVDGESGYGLCYQADPYLLELCVTIFADYDEPYHIGEIASGDQFVAHETQWNRILTLFPNAICAEMEAGAIAQVCDHFQTPFVVVRSLSDITTHPKSHLDFETYTSMASKRSAMLCKAIVAAYC